MENIEFEYAIHLIDAFYNDKNDEIIQTLEDWNEGFSISSSRKFLINNCAIKLIAEGHPEIRSYYLKISERLKKLEQLKKKSKDHKIPIRISCLSDDAIKAVVNNINSRDEYDQEHYEMEYINRKLYKNLSYLDFISLN